jgi:hypothetical protein
MDCLAVQLAHMGALEAREIGRPINGFMMQKGSTTFRLANAKLDCPCHVCAFFTSKEEEYRVLIPFMQEAIARGEACINIIDKNNRNGLVERLLDDAGDERPARAAALGSGTRRERPL